MDAKTAMEIVRSGELDKSSDYVVAMALRDNWDEVMPEAVEYLERPDIGDWYWYLIYLLAQHRTENCLHLALKILELPNDDINSHLGDALTESYHRAIANLATRDDLDTIVGYVKNGALYPYASLCAAESLIAMYVGKVLTAEDLYGIFPDVLNGIWDSDIRTLLLCSIIDTVPDERYYEIINSLSKNRKIETDIATADELKRGLKRTIDTGMPASPWRYPPIDDAFDECGFNLEQMESEEGDFSKFRADIPSVKTKKKKVGVNEKCPCGSGKKYKKCCMMKDLGKVKV